MERVNYSEEREFCQIWLKNVVELSSFFFCGYATISIFFKGEKMVLKLEEIQLPKVESIDDEIRFQTEATLHDVALYMEVWFANWSGLENGEYQIGHRFSFHRLPNGEKEFKEKIREKLWSKYFWSGSYFLATTGGVSIEILKKYVENQGNEDHRVKKVYKKRCK